MPKTASRLFFLLPEKVLKAAVQRLLTRHPEVIERLGPKAGASFLILPRGLPLAIRLCPGHTPPDVTVHSSKTDTPASAHIRGTPQDLLALLEGRTDGDALFFNQVLEISGDTEAVVALRNALDGTDIDLLEEATRPLGVFQKTGQHLFRALSALARTPPTETSAPHEGA